ncbi:hypothetical protein [Helicobacter anatolicus]|uniref:hypothetical protein n=1 Tax=Helicobacter anatolicus TaxID=2905874 RepID=UPI001E5391C1|nr:hypothetical protein [Helicobacter anatolicus]MCE3039554.1 hypothetical protein [Helicobacter anatolicus]
MNVRKRLGKIKRFFFDSHISRPIPVFSKPKGAILSTIEKFCNRDFFEEHKKERHVGYFDLDLKAKDPKSPLNPWAFIRVKDEEKTLKASLYSILGAIQRGVIAYHDITDNSEKIILEFCKKFPNFKPYHYPYTIKIKNPKTPEEYLHYFYNFALSKIPKNEFLIKIDTDHIYDSKRLFKSFYAIKNKMHVLSIPRVDFAIAKVGGVLPKKSLSRGIYWHAPII